MLALEDGGDAFEAHAGIDAEGRGRGVPGAGGVFVELHEDEVPDFDEPVPVLIRAAGGAAGDVVAPWS